MLARHASVAHADAMQPQKLSTYHPRSSVMCLDVVLEMSFGDSLNVLSRSQNGSTKGSVLESSCMEVVEDHFLCLSLNLQISNFI